jgi:hypothetical protein
VLHRAHRGSGIAALSQVRPQLRVLQVPHNSLWVASSRQGRFQDRLSLGSESWANWGPSGSLPQDYTLQYHTPRYHTLQDHKSMVARACPVAPRPAHRRQG